MNKKKLQEALLEVKDICFEAGEIILSFQKKRHLLKIQDKGIEGIATEADLASEQFIISELRKLNIKARFLSEEQGLANSLDQSLQWVIDPLDGTNNFVNGIPIYAISVSLVENGQPIIGVVYNPLSGECFFAAKGLGSFFVDFRVNPLKKFELKKSDNHKEPRDCIFSPSPDFSGHSRFEKQLSCFKKNITGARAVRRLGSAAIELCYVANGNFDGYWEQGLKPWDVAAAGLICLEAGVTVTDYDGELFLLSADSIIAVRETLYSKIMGKITGSKK